MENVGGWIFIFLYFAVPSYMFWIKLQTDGESPARAFGLIVLWLVTVGGFIAASAAILNWSSTLGLFLLGLFFIWFVLAGGRFDHPSRCDDFKRKPCWCNTC